MDAQIVLPRALAEELDSNEISLAEEIQNSQPEVSIGHKSTAGHKDVVTILTASASVITALSPVIVTLLERLFPKKKITVSTKNEEGNILYEVVYEEK